MVNECKMGRGRTLKDLSRLALLDLHLVYVAFVVTSYWKLGWSVLFFKDGVIEER